MKYWQSLLRYFSHKKDERRYCEKILGTQGKVNNFAHFYEENNDELAIVGSYMIHQFVTNNDFTPTELAAYKKGVYDMGKMFEMAYQEKERRKQK